MSIVTHHKNGLTVGLLSSSEKTIPCDIYKIKSETLVVYCKQTLTFYDVNTMNAISTFATSEIKELRLSECGNFCTTLDFNKICKVFTPEKLIASFTNAFTASISSTKLVLRKEANKIYVFSVNELVQNEKAEPKIFENVKFCKLFGDFLILAVITNENEDSKIAVQVYQETFLSELKMETLDKMEVKSDKKGNFLFLLTKKYHCEGYYGDDHIYFYNHKKNSFSYLEIEQPSLYFEFMEDRFAVCYGYQPSNVAFFNFDCKIVKKLSKGSRNSIYFNRHYNLVAFCGFGSMPGEIEIFDCSLSKVIAKFRVLGASLFFWSPCGSYFCVCITSYMQDGNSITKYDYFGREIERKEYEKLYDAQWIGKIENFKKLAQPEKLLIEKSVLYVPPAVDFKIEPVAKKQKNKKVVAPVQKPMKSKEAAVDIESVKRELKFLEEVKLKQERNENLELNDYNLLLKEDWLNDKMKDFVSKKE